MLNIKNSPFILAFLVLCSVTVIGWCVYDMYDAEKTVATDLTFHGDKGIIKSVQNLSPGSLVGKDALVLNYDLHGVCILKGPASAITLYAFDGKSYAVSLADYGQNCVDGEQTARIPLKDFSIDEPLDNLYSMSIQFWDPTSYDIRVQQIKLYQPALLGFSTDEARDQLLAKVSSRPKPLKSSRTALHPKITATSATSTPATTSPASVASSTPTVTSVATTTSWLIKSVSSMKETKDKVCGQDSPAFINAWINKAVELGVNYISIETPYDDPACASSVSYTQKWVDAVHAKGLHVWHRHMPLAFEGIYSTPKDASKDYLALISDYIKAHPTFFRAGDIFTPIPEPQNGGISGITYCPQNICVFSGATSFNKWLRDAMTVSENAFASIGLGGKIKIGYYGFDGFVAWGDNNPDWNGILEDATIAAMGNITIDHYPEIVGDTMENDLNELQAKYPHTPIVIGEWGTITGGDTVTEVKNSMQAALRQNVIGFNYWHMGLGGKESLLNDDMTEKIDFATVKSFFSK